MQLVKLVLRYVLAVVLISSGSVLKANAANKAEDLWPGSSSDTSGSSQLVSTVEEREILKQHLVLIKQILFSIIQTELANAKIIIKTLDREQLKEEIRLKLESQEEVFVEDMIYIKKASIARIEEFAHSLGIDVHNTTGKEVLAQLKGLAENQVIIFKSEFVPKMKIVMDRLKNYLRGINQQELINFAQSMAQLAKKNIKAFNQKMYEFGAQYGLTESEVLVIAGVSVGVLSLMFAPTEVTIALALVGGWVTLCKNPQVIENVGLDSFVSPYDFQNKACLQ